MKRVRLTGHYVLDTMSSGRSANSHRKANWSVKSNKEPEFTMHIMLSIQANRPVQQSRIAIQMLNLSSVRERDDFRVHVRVVVGDLPETELGTRVQCCRRPPLIFYAVQLIKQTLVGALPLLHFDSLHTNLNCSVRESLLQVYVRVCTPWNIGYQLTSMPVWRSCSCDNVLNIQFQERILYLEERAGGLVVAHADFPTRSVLELPDLAARHTTSAVSRPPCLVGATHHRARNYCRARARARDGVRVAAVEDAVAPGRRALLLAASTLRACVGLKYRMSTWELNWIMFRFQREISIIKVKKIKESRYTVLELDSRHTLNPRHCNSDHIWRWAWNWWHPPRSR